MSPPRVTVLFAQIGPYHRARLEAAAELLDVMAIQYSNVSRTYSWGRAETGQMPFRCDTLFSDELVHLKARHEVKRRLARCLADSRADAVAIPGWDDRVSCLAHAWCYRNRKPVILMSASNHHDHVRCWWKEAAKRRLLRGVAAGFAGGSSHVDYLAGLGVARERIFVGYDVVDNEHFAEGASAAQAHAEAVRSKFNLPDRYFLASSRFVEKKNLPRLLEAYRRYWSKAGRQAWHLVLLGDGPLREMLERQVQDLGLERDVHLPGFKQYHELPAFYGLAGAFVHASTTEQWGLVVNEAMASGLPVIVSRRCGCAPDLVDHGRNGFVFDPFDIEALAEHLGEMASDDCDRTAMSVASREIIRRWTPRTFAENLLKAAEVATALPPSKARLADAVLRWALALR